MEDLTLTELFDRADEIGNKYQDAEEIASVRAKLAKLRKDIAKEVKRIEEKYPLL